MTAATVNVADTDREQLIQKHIRFVAYLAHKMNRTSGMHLFTEVDELISDGCIGLIEAAQKFDPDREIDFRTFAKHRIRGAMLDGVRKFNLLSREKKEDCPRSRAFSILNDSATVALDAKRSDGSLCQDLPDKKEVVEDVVLDRIEQEEVAERVQKALSQLDEQERHIIQRSFFDGMSLAEIGQELGVTGSNICRIRSKVYKKLREMGSIQACRVSI